MDTLTLLAPAKINICLEVLGRREDGYHEVSTVLQAIDLADHLTFELHPNLQIEINPRGILSQEGNLVLKAAELLRREVNVTSGAKIVLAKNIPISSGLGGGSSDAAATLVGLRQLWGLNLSDERLIAISARLGADVPFFIRGGTALGSGTGTKLLQLPSPVEQWAVLLIPTSNLPDNKTKLLYGLLTKSNFSDSPFYSDEIVHRLNNGRQISDLLFNSFEFVASKAYPDYLANRAGFGDIDVLLAGAGPSLFALKVDEPTASRLSHRLREQGHDARAIRLLPAWDPQGIAGTALIVP